MSVSTARRSEAKSLLSRSLLARSTMNLYLLCLGVFNHIRGGREDVSTNELRMEHVSGACFFRPHCCTLITCKIAIIVAVIEQPSFPIYTNYLLAYRRVRRFHRAIPSFGEYPHVIQHWLLFACLLCSSRGKANNGATHNILVPLLLPGKPRSAALHTLPLYTPENTISYTVLMVSTRVHQNSRKQ